VAARKEEGAPDRIFQPVVLHPWIPVSNAKLQAREARHRMSREPVMNGIQEKPGQQAGKAVCPAEEIFNVAKVKTGFSF
jgi:hypothetical protein